MRMPRRDFKLKFKLYRYRTVSSKVQKDSSRLDDDIRYVNVLYRYLHFPVSKHRNSKHIAHNKQATWDEDNLCRSHQIFTKRGVAVLKLCVAPFLPHTFPFAQIDSTMFSILIFLSMFQCFDINTAVCGIIGII